MRFSQKAKVDIPVENSFKQKDKYTVRDLSLATGKESTAQESPVSKLRCQGDQYQRRHLLHTVTDGPTTHKNFDIYEKPVLNGFERLPRSPKYHCEPILQHDDTVRGNGDGKDEYDAGCDEGNWSTWYSGETVMQERAYGSKPNDISTWVEYTDPVTGHPYLFNPVTGETLWKND